MKFSGRYKQWTWGPRDQGLLGPAGNQHFVEVQLYTFQHSYILCCSLLHASASLDQPHCDYHLDYLFLSFTMLNNHLYSSATALLYACQLFHLS